MISDAAAGPLVYLDSNIFIDAFETDPAKSTLGALFALLLKYPGSAMTSELTYGELLGRHGTFPSWDEQKAFYKGLLFGSAFISVMPINRGILEHYGDLRLEARQNARSLRLADAIHAATALAGRCVYFLTSDARLGPAVPTPLRYIAPTQADLASLLKALDA